MSRNIFFAIYFIYLLLLIGCAGTFNVPPREFEQFSFKDGSKFSLEKEKIKITLNLLRPTDMLEYPQYCSFDPDQLPAFEKKKFYKILTYKDDRIWNYIFSSPDYKKGIIACHVVMENNTDHILRMRDARIYLIPKNTEPIAALSTLSEVQDLCTKLEGLYEGEKGLTKNEQNFWIGNYPVGLSEAILELNKEHIKLITDVGAEVLPTFSYSGLLVFPYISDDIEDLTISFFDITVETDAAGNAVRKTRFDFPLMTEKVKMEYNSILKRWITSQ